MVSSWDFHAGDVCRAAANNPHLSLEITASSSELVLAARIGRGLAIPPRRAVPIAFAGTSGSWSIFGHTAGARLVVASRPITDENVGQILVLLEGGLVTVGRPEDGLPKLRVPNGGAPGRGWFDCVRRQLFP